MIFGPPTDVSNAPLLPGGLTVHSVLPARDIASAAAAHDHTMIDIDGELAKRFGTRAGTAVLVRPDGHVALAAPDVASIFRQLTAAYRMKTNAQA